VAAGAFSDAGAFVGFVGFSGFSVGAAGALGAFGLSAGRLASGVVTTAS
jgi:hypothetical protein